MFFFDVFQAPVAQHVAIACGQAQWLELGADAAQGVELLDAAFESARTAAMMENDLLLASKIAAFQFRDIRPKAASEIEDIGEASLLLGHTMLHE